MENIKIRQTIIIVWKWRFFPNPISEQVLDSLHGGKVPSIEEGKGAFVPHGGDKGLNLRAFHIPFGVDWSEACPNARLVAAAIYQGEGANSRLTQLLDDLIDHYIQPTTNQPDERHKVMLFLHRADGYDEKDVERLLSQRKDTRDFKVFLFSDRRDYIYYDTQQSGFLDDLGDFKAYRDAHGNIIRVQDERTGNIKQPYFDRVWAYYDNEFERKVFKLKEDLFDCLFPLLVPSASNVVRRNTCVETVKREKGGLLWYRLNSFLGTYEDIENKDPDVFEANTAKAKEVDVIMQAEKNRGESLLFDDCIANIKQQRDAGQTFVSEEYDEIKTDFERLLLSEPHDADIEVKDLRSVASKLNYLVKIIPGVMD